MCGICGFCDFTRDNAGPVWREAGERMGETLAHRGPDGKGLWQGADCVLVHRRLAVIDPERGQQPMARVRDGVEYVLIYNGELYNTDELRRELRKLGFSFETESDTEVLLNACSAWGDGAAQRLEGIFAFAFWDGGRRRLMCCRDRFGVKPFFYAWKDGALVFASELKALFQYPGLEPRLGRQGLCEVLGIGPARTAGAGVFEGVRELKGGCQMMAGPEGLQIRRYWALESRPHEDGYEETVEKVRHLLEGAIRRQLVSDVPLCTFLSGGLDSSIITAVAARAYQEQGREPLETYSFDYVGNRKHFKASAFQPDADATSPPCSSCSLRPWRPRTCRGWRMWTPPCCISAGRWRSGTRWPFPGSALTRCLAATPGLSGRSCWRRTPSPGVRTWSSEGRW